MSERLLICTDLDRTLIPNGPQPESPGARQHFANLTDSPGVILAYVSGRDRKRIEKAIVNYDLPTPDFVISDVGATIFHVGAERDWRHQADWEQDIGRDWGDLTHSDLKQLLGDLPDLRLQEYSRQGTHKLSYYVPLYSDRDALSSTIGERLVSNGVQARLIWSMDELKGVGLLDVLPERASKFHAVEAIIEQQGFSRDSSIFCGDSGNDIEVLASPVPAVLVANSQPDVREQAYRLANERGYLQQLYIAKGGFMGMNGNYSAGILEGIAHFHPGWIGRMGFITRTEQA